MLYVPSLSLSEEDVKSLVKLSLSEDNHRVDTHGGRKVAIKYLLNLQSTGFDLSPYLHSKQLKQLDEQFHHLKQYDYFKQEFHKKRDQGFEPYWELNLESPKIHPLAIDNRQLTSRRSFSPEQLKVYFNRKQIRNISLSDEHFQTSGFLDDDARKNINQNPIQTRKNKGQINTKQSRVEKAIFDIPPGKQIIVLDFADERMPGGLFLYGASTQEETICYHSDTYRALMDFKYNRFDGGFIIPEFGCLYIKDVHFTKGDKQQKIDIIVAACYDLTGEHGLYRPPESQKDILNNTRKKLAAIIAAAQANTEGDGSNTYLLLGPIGCGAFRNNIRTIASLWDEVLCEPLNEKSKTEQRHAFENIWFLSATDQKLEVFEHAFHLDAQQRLK